MVWFVEGVVCGVGGVVGGECYRCGTDGGWYGCGSGGGWYAVPTPHQRL